MQQIEANCILLIALDSKLGALLLQKFIKEDPSKHFFEDTSAHNHEGNVPPEEAVANDGVLFCAENRNEDINFVQNRGMTVDDGYDPWP